MNQETLSFFKKVDPKLYPYLDKFQKEIELNKLPADQYFYRLCRSIAFQQLSGKAASTIWGRFEQLLPGEKVTPAEVLKLTIEQMRAVGLSNAKASYIHNIAEAFSGDANYDNLDKLSDEEVIELLTKIKGVGRWTAEMFLMFTLGREDVFSHGDWGLIKGIMKVYGYKDKPTKKQVEKIVKKWHPYSSYASLTLWRVLDTQV